MIRPRGPRLRVAAALLALGLPSAPTRAARADVYYLRDGDRIGGRTIAEGTRGFRVQTPYGRLTIPRNRIERIVRDDGTERVLNPRAEPEPVGPPPPPVRLMLVVSGHAFWYAWDPPRGAAVDPTIRLQVSLDEEEVGAYVDARPDPEELPRVPFVNSFTFRTADLALTAAGAARLLPPETRPGRTVLRIELPDEEAGERRLRIAYQINDGTLSSPAWRDLVETSVDVVLRREAPAFVQVRQDRGKMAFSGLLRRRMKNVETFRVEARCE